MKTKVHNEKKDKKEKYDARKLLIGSMIVGLCSALVTSSAQAISIDFSPQNQFVNINDSVLVDVVVSDLETGGINEIVSSFDLDIAYDSTIVSSTGFTFGTGLGFSFTSDTSSLGLIDIAETSLETDAFLQAAQGNSVNLGTLSFNAIGFGTTSLDFLFNQSNLLTGTNANILNLSSSSGSIIVNPVSVPSTLILLGIGVLAFGRQVHQNNRT